MNCAFFWLQNVQVKDTDKRSITFRNLIQHNIFTIFCANMSLSLAKPRGVCVCGGPQGFEFLFIGRENKIKQKAS